MLKETTVRHGTFRQSQGKTQEHILSRVFRYFREKQFFKMAIKSRRYISLFPKEITVHSGIVWRDKISGDRRLICERVEVSTIKYQLFRRPKMTLFQLNI